MKSFPSTLLLCLVLAVLYAFTGRISFWLDVEHVLVTPAFFFPEAISLAFALRFGAGVLPGIFVGHQLLILGRDLPVLAGLGVTAANTLEAGLAVWLFRRLQGQSDMDDIRSWILLQAMVFLVLQPFCAALGTGSLFVGGVIGDPQAWLRAGMNWWSGSGMAQSQLAPLLLILMHRRVRLSWARQIILPALVTAAVLAFALFVLDGGGIGTSLVLFQPLLFACALLLGLPAVCAASMLISVTFLYATSHGWGPFYRQEATSLFDLNVFLIGISLIGQFLAVLFRQLEDARNKEQELEKRQREEMVKKLKTSLAAAGIAHEINQPLSQILLQTEVSLRKLQAQGKGPGETLDSFRNIRSRTEQVVKTIETIRALLGNVATGHRELDLANVIRSSLLYLQPEIQRTGAEIRSRGLERPCPFHGDESQLHLLTVNLLRNALEAVKSRPQSGRIVELSLQPSDGEVAMTVEDSGPGFSDEQKLRSELPIESTKPEGMGMGLYLVRTAVDNHEGRLSLGHSPTLGGARVEITFPK